MKIEPGQKVAIKTWNQMKEEFGLNETGSILCEQIFTTSMEAFLRDRGSRILTIERSDVNFSGRYFRVEEDEDDVWYWSEQMMTEPELSHTIYEINRFELLDFE